MKMEVFLEAFPFKNNQRGISEFVQKLRDILSFLSAIQQVKDLGFKTYYSGSNTSEA